MTDASFRSVGYALMIEDSRNQKIQSKRKTYAPVAFGAKIFSPAQLKMSIYSKDFLAIYIAFLEFAHILWEATKPTIVLTDNKSVTRFFQTKQSHQRSGMHVIMCCNITSKWHTLLGQSTLQLIFSSDLNLKSRRRYVSKSEKISKQHLSRWQHLPLTSLMKNNFYSHKKTTTMSQKNKPLNGKNNLDKMRSNGQWMKNHPSWKQVWKHSQGWTETLRRIPWTELKQMQEYE